MAGRSAVILLSFMCLLAAPQSVRYPVPSVCAIRGSTVTLPCSFRSKLEIVRVAWCINHLICQGSTPTVYDSRGTWKDPRYQYLGDMTGNCSLQIGDVRRRDNTTFRFRMEATKSTGHLTGTRGVKVTVSEALTVNSSSGGAAVREDDRVTLNCTSNCTFHQLEVAWFKDGRPLRRSGRTLPLGPLTAEDAGNYSCALTGVQITSQPYSLRVQVEDKGEAGDGRLPLIVGSAFGGLLAALVLVLALVLIKRKLAVAAADKRQEPAQGEPDQMLPAWKEAQHREAGGPAADDVNYTSVVFSHKSRPAPPTEDAVIYSLVQTGRG